MVQKKSNKRRDILILLAVLVIALVAYFLTRDRFTSLFSGGLDDPADDEENLYYSIEYEISSAHVLERGGIVLKNAGDRIKAVELSSGIELDVTDLGDRSQAPILDFSEYVSYIYMFDGNTVYRSQLDGTELRATVEDCVKFEPMGDYIYSLQPVNGAYYLFRCSIIGTYEQQLFSEPFLHFLAYDGNLLLRRENGDWWWYNVTTQNSADVILPQEAREILLDREGVLYLTDTGLYRVSYGSKEGTALYEGAVAACAVGPHGLGLLLFEGEAGQCLAAVCGPSGEELTRLEGETFSPESALDLSADHLFVTDETGITHYSPINTPAWEVLFET